MAAATMPNVTVMPEPPEDVPLLEVSPGQLEALLEVT